MKIQQTPYFAFEVIAWDSWRERISLNSDNIEESLMQLEEGKNLFEVVSEMNKNSFDYFPMRYGLFERRNEITINDEKFVSTDGYKQVGKLLVPDNQIISRDEIVHSLDTTRNYMDKKIYSKILTSFPDTDKFHYEGNNTYTPLDTTKILVLNKNQL